MHLLIAHNTILDVQVDVLAAQASAKIHPIMIGIIVKAIALADAVKALHTTPFMCIGLGFRIWVNVLFLKLATIADFYA